MSCLSCIWRSQTPPKSLPDKHNDFVYLERQDKETLYSKRSRGHQPKTSHGMLYGGFSTRKSSLSYTMIPSFFGCQKAAYAHPGYPKGLRHTRMACTEEGGSDMLWGHDRLAAVSSSAPDHGGT